MNINGNVSMIFFLSRISAQERRKKMLSDSIVYIYNLANSYATQFRNYFTRNPKTKLKKLLSVLNIHIILRIQTYLIFFKEIHQLK